MRKVHSEKAPESSDGKPLNWQNGDMVMEFQFRLSGG